MDSLGLALGTGLQLKLGHFDGLAVQYAKSERNS
jgi:hypothetical protein